MFWNLARWFCANTLLPIFVPVLCLCTIEFFRDGTFPFGDTFVLFIRNGFYIFSALTLLFSLLEDYPLFKLSGLGFVFGCLIMLSLVLTLLMFYFIETKNEFYINDHPIQFLSVWVASALLAIYAKYKIVDYKNNN